MSERNHHPLSEGHFSSVTVFGDQVEIKISDKTVVFNMQTVDELIGILRGYAEDRTRRHDQWLSNQIDAGEFRSLSTMAKAVQTRHREESSKREAE